ncbi:hypothetical protein SAMN05444722_1973 [Rhodovulum sp. ES.010]|uniref:hypothetical protein n=1 Tax=Rhodovulum sp. ES.010 TaxID=1882821 RepID=UPI00092BEFC7|nr:hypothetical protein [Rhodovulum sp. ES.010]SIO41192.1 hypothetical protein SAMN05444722_1973 [Rhodovulum sp. ES.010]
MQLLCRHDLTDFDAWKAAFDQAAEERRNAGLTVLQAWREADRETRIFVLYEVNVRDKAETYLATEARLMAGRAGVTDSSHHFLQTL